MRYYPSQLSAKAIGSIAVLLLCFGTANFASAQASSPDDQAQKARFVFMPDIHLRRDLESPEDMAKALQSVSKLKPKPDFIVTGGDLIHDMRSMDLAEAEQMTELFQKIWNENTDIPAYHVLGNHDVAGLNNESFSKDHPLHGSDFLKEKLGMPGLFYSFDRAGWHFIVLHNFRVTSEKKFISEFSAEQMDFLKRDIEQNGDRPTIIFAHYPAVTAAEFLDGAAKQGKDAWELGYGRATRNPMALLQTIQGGNVKAYLSGHTHRLDTIKAMENLFIGSGSVSGSQWKGKQVDTAEGYTVVDINADGSFEHRYHVYGWQAPGN